MRTLILALALASLFAGIADSQTYSTTTKKRHGISGDISGAISGDTVQPRQRQQQYQTNRPGCYKVAKGRYTCR